MLEPWKHARQIGFLGAILFISLALLVPVNKSTLLGFADRQNITRCDIPDLRRQEHHVRYLHHTMAFLLATKLAAAATSVDFTAPLTTATSGALELRADATATSSSVVALTTTFTPPASCADDHLTMLTAKSYQIWINEPAPLPGSLLSDCYPSEWVGSYSSAVGSSSSMVPVMSPLVCPSGWKTQTANSWSSGYLACCASYVTPAQPISLRPPGYAY